MAVIDLVMPKMGESIMEATILKWHKKVVDSIKNDETLLDIATDKVDSEVPSTAGGIVQEILFQENDVVPIGTVIARISNEAAQTIAAPVAPIITVPAPVIATPVVANEEVKPADIPYTPTSDVQTDKPSMIRFYSPLVLSIAQQEGISMSDLEKIPGTGADGRVSKRDILAFVAGGKQLPAGETAPAVVVPTPVVTESQAAPTTTESATVDATETEVDPLVAKYGNNVEIVEMDRMRKMIAKHMVDSKQTSPHVTSFAEADVTNMVLWRDRIKTQYEKQEGQKITFTPLFVEAIIKCIKKFPIINSSVDGTNIVIKRDINIGMATALPSGNLIVPVIKNADYLNLTGLTKTVNSLADAARNGKLKPDDTAGGTFTLTNVGTFGSIMGTPIINQPQVAILAVGAIKKRPVVVETELGDSIAIRHMMYLSLSYDHRIIDGSIGSQFLVAVAKELENFDIHRAI
jgi:2-oxoglutarate dehydrogenase E2 component (dihydrolipoamide succinyltransferase)